MTAPLPAGPAVPAPSVRVRDRARDLRLLVPALVAWAGVALLLGSPVDRVVTLAEASAGGALAAGGWAVVASRRGGPVAVRRGLGAVALAALTLTLGGLAAATGVRDAGPVRQLVSERAVVTVVGTLASDPRLLPTPRGRPESASSVLVRLDVERVTGRGAESVVASPVLVFGDPAWLTTRWQQRLRVTGRLAPPTDPSDDVLAVLTPSQPPEVVDEPGVVAAAAGLVRSRFAEATDGLPADARGLLPGLVIGDTSRTPPELDDAMLVTGMTHLSAVSGSNVAIVLAAALGLARRVGLRRRWRPLLAGALLLGFVVLVRPEPSVVRAAAMGAVGLVGLSVSRRAAGMPALGAAVVGLLCWDPWLARSPGFALSTLATLGLLLFAASWGEVLSRWLPPRIRGWGPALAVPCAAQLMCAPVIVLLQGAVSVVGVLANLLAAPLVAPATVLGVGTALVSVVSPTVGSLVGWLAALPTLGIAWVARTGAAAPFASIPWAADGWGAGVLAGLSLLLLLTAPWLAHHARRRPAFPAAGVVVLLAAAVPTRLGVWPPPGWAVVMCDVGQGDGIVLSTGPGRAVVVDAGPDPAIVDGCLARLGVDVVDTLVLTHFHADHVDGMPGVLHRRTVRQVLTTPVHEPDYQWREVSDWARAAGIPLAEVHAGDELAWPGLSAHVWWPARVIEAGSVPNNASVVMSVEVGGLRLLMLGDVEREAAHQVLLALRAADRGARGPPVVDVLKVAHHGSANRDDELLAYVRAPVALVSVGAGNDYGHPAPSTVTELGKDGFRVYRTDQSGDIVVRRAGGEVGGAGAGASEVAGVAVGAAVEVTTSR